MTIATITSVTATMKDMYPLPGTRIKQWVVDMRREAAWERETCPRFSITEHDDNCERGWCRNVGDDTTWTALDHDSCYTCGVVHRALRDVPAVREWLALKAARPSVETDRDKLSDEVEPVPPKLDHPLFTLTRRQKYERIHVPGIIPPGKSK